MESVNPSEFGAVGSVSNWTGIPEDREDEGFVVESGPGGSARIFLFIRGNRRSNIHVPEHNKKNQPSTHKLINTQDS